MGGVVATTQVSSQKFLLPNDDYHSEPPIHSRIQYTFPAYLSHMINFFVSFKQHFGRLLISIDKISWVMSWFLCEFKILYGFHLH